MTSLNRPGDFVHSGDKIESTLDVTNHTNIQESVNVKEDFPRIKDYITTITILENITEAIFILNTEGRIEYANKVALELLQSDFDHLVGRFIDEILIDSIDIDIDNKTFFSDQTNNGMTLIENLKQGVFGNIEATLVSKENAVPVFLNFSVVDGINGEVNYIIVTAIDISYRKSIEKELRQQQVLSISRDRLKALGELSVGLMHELSQPLGTLKLKVEMMHSFALNNKNGDKGKISDNLTEVMELIDRMSCIIQNIRSYAHQTEDNIMTIVNVNETIDNACYLVSYEMKKNNIELIIKKGKRIPFVIANPLSIEQVFVNLLTNARDAFTKLEQKNSPPYGIKKRIKICVKSIKSKWVEITVEDNAGGIDIKHRKKIFDPFFTTKEPGMNSGVGLSISKSIITSLGGDINLSVKEDQGTKFTIRIPVGQKDERAQLFDLIEMLHQN